MQEQMDNVGDVFYNLMIKSQSFTVPVSLHCDPS